VVPLPGDGLGLEASGEVLRVGPDVKDLRHGDRVMLLGFGALSTRMVVTEKLCEKIPDSLTFDKAASIPTVFVTAACSLFDIGGLQKGQVRFLSTKLFRH
jgi:NADPH:quinone reductase-like Zn-dependent oxidoreductase